MATKTSDMKLTMQQVATAFDFFSSDELLTLNRHLVALVKQRNAIKRMQATMAFKVGDKVQFKNSKTGKTHLCQVNKVKRVMVNVTELPGSVSPGMRWNVGSTLLSKV